MTGTKDNTHNMHNMHIQTLTHEHIYKIKLEREDKGAPYSGKLNFGAEFSHRSNG